MASRSPYKLLPAADADLDDIFAFGLERFGWQQAEAYARALGDVFQLLADNPILGASRDHVAAGLRAFQSNAHTIFYRPARADEHASIVVVRVLGAHMDHPRHLSQ